MSDEQIISEVHKLQSKQKGMKAIVIICVILMTFGPVGALFMDTLTAAVMIPMVVLIVIAIVVLIVVSKSIPKVEKKLKLCVGEHVVKGVIAERMEVIKYDPDDFIKRETIKKSGLVPGWDRITGSDYVKATYKGREIVYCDIHLEQEHRDDDGKGTEWVTVFKGPFVWMPMKENINGYVKMKERRNPRKKGLITKALGTALDALGVDTDPNAIELENVEFNEKFRVETDNDELAFYILTPHFMESILRIDELAEGYTNINFKGKAVNIAIYNNRDAFEVGKSIHNANSLEKCRADMRKDLDVILEIIDEILEKDRLF